MYVQYYFAQRSLNQKMIKSLKGILYEITITDSTLDYIHGFQYNIFEIYIPAFKIFINQQGVWRHHKERYNSAIRLKEIEIPIMTAKVLSDTVKFKEESNRICKKILKDSTISLKTKSQIQSEKKYGEVPKKLTKEIKQTIKKMRRKSE